MLVVFFVNNLTFLDPDFGWHLKLGELISRQGIPSTDPFSYTMPSFPFVDHEWLTNIIFYDLYQNVGMAVMALLFAAIALLALLVVKPQNEGSAFALAPFLLACAVLLPFLGVRPQVETWALTAVLLKVVTDDRLWVKWRWFLPVYFVLWANLHGGFVLGLVILIFVSALKSLVQRKIFTSDLVVVLSSILVTLLNPYGFNLWKEVWQQLSDNNLRSAIMEWIPLFLGLDWALLAFMPLAVLSGILIYRYRSKLTLTQISLYVFLMLAGLSSRRHTPLWVLTALPLTIQTLGFFYKEIGNIKFAQERFNKAYKVFLIAAFFFLALEAFFYVGDLKKRQEKNFYPQQAVQFLKQRSRSGRIFSSYHWGGYLIWKLPEQKVFVDGRMPSWRWQAPYQQESSAAFDEYDQVLNNIDGLKILDKYQVQFVLWPKNKHIEGFEDRLQKAKWQKVYEDQTGTVYERSE